MSVTSRARRGLSWRSASGGNNRRYAVDSVSDARPSPPVVSEVWTTASLELASKLVGDEAVLQTSETTGGDGRASVTESVAYRRLLPPEALRQLKPRRALLVYGHLPPVLIRLRPWFRSRRLATLAMAVDAAVPHPAMAVDDLASVEVLRPTDEGEAAA